MRFLVSSIWIVLRFVCFCKDGPGTFSRVRCLEERKGGTGERGGAHPVRLSELPMKFLPNRLFAPAPIKRKVDGGEAMKRTWATEKGNRRTGENGCEGPQVLMNKIRG